MDSAVTSLPGPAVALAQAVVTAADDPATRAAGHVLPPVAVLALCIVAGIGTVLLLPSRNREPAVRKVGGAVLLLAGLVLVGLLVRIAAGTVGPNVYFWAFAALAVLGSVRVVTHPRPVYSALYFVLTVFATAGLFVLLWAEFMAAALVLIYAGAILVTYVFVIMLAASSTGSTGMHGGGGRSAAAAGLAEYDGHSREPVIAAAVGFGLMGVLLFVIFDRAAATAVAPRPGGPVALGAYEPRGDTQELGAYLFQNHVVNLEVAGIILTLGMVGAIMIARRRVVGGLEPKLAEQQAVLSAPATPTADDPASIPVYGTDNPRQKAYPQT